MKVRFWGTRGSIPKPGPGTLRYGGNTSCVEVQSAAGTRIVLDCGSGAQDLGHALLAAGPRPVSGHILISHTHWDHIQGLPFFAPLFVSGNEWDIYGPHGFCHSLRDALAGQMQYTYFPIALQHFGATMRYHDLVEGAFQLADLSIRTQYLNHPALTLAYRLESDGVSLVYACDHEPYARRLASGLGEVEGRDREHAEFLAGADLVIHDGQYTAEEYPSKIGWGHSTVEYAAALCRLAGARRLAITHHDPLRDDQALDRLIARVRGGEDRGLDVFAAAEGQVLELAPARPGRGAHAAQKHPAKSAVPPGLLNQTVLLAASDPELARAITGAVAADNVQVVQIRDGASAVRVLEAEQAALVVLEHRLPQHDALETCRAIRRLDGRFSEVPVVLIAAPEDAPPGGAVPGVTDWLIKPFSEVYARTRLHAELMRTVCRWMRAPPAPDERQRLAALRKLGILDTAPEERFDRVTRLAAALFEVPIALISLVDQDRQWFKSCHGLAVQETSREVSFCAHAILGGEVMVVPDTLLDPRFADSPVVSEDPRVRFYAGYPLALEDGARIGTLCLIDTRPRWIDEARLALLKDLGRMVEQELQAPRPGAKAMGRAERSPAASEPSSRA